MKTTNANVSQEYDNTTEVQRCDINFYSKEKKVQLRSNGKLYVYQGYSWRRLPLRETSQTAIMARIKHNLPMPYAPGENPEYDGKVNEVLGYNKMAEKSIGDKSNRYQNLIKKHHGNPIPTTEENLKIILDYLNTFNWAGWALPEMEIPYKAHQFNCDGTVASAIELSKSIIGGHKFCVNAPNGYLQNYKKL